VVEPDGIVCDDGDVCTIGDTCGSGVCAGDSGPGGLVTCGDGIFRAICGEECDDGNNVDCDGCSSACSLEDEVCGVQSGLQRDCINSLNKSLANVARAQGREILTCMRLGARGKLTGTIEACLSADSNGRMSRATLRTELAEMAKCLIDRPTFAVTGATTINDFAIQNENDLIHDVFGADLDVAIATIVENRDRSRCQQAVTRVALKCRNNKLAEFNSCKKKGLRKVTITDAASLRSSCLGTDSRLRVARACDPVVGRVRRVIHGRCGGLDLAAAFPGCNTNDPTTLAACIDSYVECRVCLAAANADDFSAGICDLMDNGTQDGSCGSILPVAKCGPGSHWMDGPCDPGLESLIDTSLLIGIDLDSDCLADLSMEILGDTVVQRSSSIDQSLNFPGPTDCNGATCGVVDGHLDVIDIEILSMSLTGGDVAFRAGDSGTVPLAPSLGTTLESIDPTLADSFFDIFFEIELEGVRFYNHLPVRVESQAIQCAPADATYVHQPQCLPLFDDPTPVGVQIGALVSAEHSTNRCGNNVAGDQEQCDGTDDSACPGLCQADCTCP
jgi:cysteine-rich repeat protein